MRARVLAAVALLAIAVAAIAMHARDDRPSSHDPAKRVVTATSAPSAPPSLPTPSREQTGHATAPVLREPTLGVRICADVPR